MSYRVLLLQICVCAYLLICMCVLEETPMFQLFYQKKKKNQSKPKDINQQQVVHQERQSMRCLHHAVYSKVTIDLTQSQR